MTPGPTHLGPDLTHAIELHLRNCELARGLHARKASIQQQVQPFVAMSRQVGAGGSQIGHDLAARLEWPVFDQEILRLMAGDNEIRGKLYEWMDERDTSWLEQMLESLQIGRYPPQDYIRKLCNTILVLARSGSGVFLGRGADLILPADCGLRIRVVAPFKQRVQRYAERNRIEEAAARVEVARIDRERSDFIRNHFHREIDDPTRCAVTINTGQMSHAEGIGLIVNLLEKRGIGTRA